MSRILSIAFAIVFAFILSANTAFADDELFGTGDGTCTSGTCTIGGGK